jgi:hypothetical protein
MTPLFAASFQDLYAIFAALSFTVTVLVLAFSVTGLVGTFHNLSLFYEPDIKVIYRHKNPKLQNLYF